MDNLKQSRYNDGDQDQLITQIKSIASQIFTIDFDQFISMDLNIPRKHPLEQYQKTYSYTDRPINIDKQDCLSEWITYQNFEDKQINKVINKKNTEPPNTDMNGKQKIKKQQNKTKNKASPNKQSKKNLIKSNFSVTQQQNSPKTNQNQQRNEKIKIENLSQYGFMKPLEKSKKSILIETYKKKQEQQQPIKFQKMKTLEQLYSQKEPLYEKFIREKQKKTILISESRITNEQIQAKSLRQKPVINSNIKVKGSFDERLRNNIKKSEQSKAKVMNDVLKDSPFQPQLNSSKKYKNVESVIKKNWFGNKLNMNDQIQLVQSNILNHQTQFNTQNLSIKKQKSKRNSKKPLDLRLESSKQLCHILQIQGKQQQ